LHYPAVPPAKPTPIVFLHGGPGAYLVDHPPSVARFYQSLAKLGFDVYLYDQIGSGRSARLDDPRQYTVDRNIRDLDAIRDAIKAQKLILIGDSWGAMLAAYYMAAHPDHCARAIFGGPGALDQTQIPAGVYSDAPMVQAAEAWFAEMYRRRYPNLQRLINDDPVAAHRVLSDREMDTQLDSFIQNSQPHLVCDAAKIPSDLFTHGMGWWANEMISLDLNRHPPRPLAKLARNRTPVLILRGGCDYIHWDAAYQYRKTFPNSTLLYVPRAGHAFGFDQPELYTKAVQAFLLDQPLPVPPYTGSEAPPREMPRKSVTMGE
jgi:proline iminopeptidase